MSVISSDLTTSFYSFGNGIISDFNNLLNIRRYLIEKNIKEVIFNSADGIRIRNLLLFPFPKEMEFAGILHDSEKVIRSGNQKFINKKVKKYFVLNDYILDYIHSLKLEKQSSRALPGFPTGIWFGSNLKPPGEFRICIPAV